MMVELSVTYKVTGWLFPSIAAKVMNASRYTNLLKHQLQSPEEVVKAQPEGTDTDDIDTDDDDDDDDAEHVLAEQASAKMGIL